MFDFDHKSSFLRRIQTALPLWPEYLDSGYRQGVYYIPDRQFRNSKGLYVIFTRRCIQVTSDIKRICRSWEYFYIQVKIPKSKDNMWIVWEQSISAVSRRLRQLFEVYFGMADTDYNSKYDPDNCLSYRFGVSSISEPTRYNRRGRRESRKQPLPSYVRITILKGHRDFATVVDQLCVAMNWKTHDYKEIKAKGIVSIDFRVSPEPTLGEEIIDEVLQYWKGKTIG